MEIALALAPLIWSLDPDFSHFYSSTKDICHWNRIPTSVQILLYYELDSILQGALTGPLIPSKKKKGQKSRFENTSNHH